MKDKLIISALIVVIVANISLIFNQSSISFGGGDGFVAKTCTPTESIVTVGHQESRTLLAANGRRAWATIQQPASATNTVSLSFGGTAAAGQGYLLIVPPANGTASTTIEKAFGLNTDFPFTGAVTGRTSAASSTLLVIQCVYTR